MRSRYKKLRKRRAKKGRGKKSRKSKRTVFGDVASTRSLGLLNRTSTLDPFPQKWFKPLTYGDTFVMTLPALGVSSEQIFRLNSLVDPDLTGGGHQPMYRDQIAALYNAYQVRKARVQIVFTDPSQDGAFVFVNSGFSTTAGRTISFLQEMPFTKVEYLNNTGSQRIVFDEMLDLAKAAGLTRAQYKQDIASTGALIGASPVLGLYLRFGAGNTNATTGAGTVIASIRITYHTMFYDRVIPAQS